MVIARGGESRFAPLIQSQVAAAAAAAEMKNYPKRRPGIASQTDRRILDKEDRDARLT